jgi:hypothetical protein
MYFSILSARDGAYLPHYLNKTERRDDIIDADMYGE